MKEAEKTAKKEAVEAKKSESEAEKLAKEADKIAKKAEAEAEKLAKKESAETEKLLKKEAAEADKIAKKASLEAEKLAKEADKIAKKAVAEAEKLAKKESSDAKKVQAEVKKIEKALKAAEKQPKTKKAEVVAAAVAEVVPEANAVGLVAVVDRLVVIAAPVENAKVKVKRIEVDGKKYLKTGENVVYDEATSEVVGTYDPIEEKIIFAEVVEESGSEAEDGELSEEEYEEEDE